jgi:Spy/CpxP family protein refolding chaperone
MKTSKMTYFLAFLFSASALAQQTTPPPQPPQNGMIAGPKILIRHEMGEWWKNSDTAKKMQLSESQIAQLDQIFTDHRTKLANYGREMGKQDLELQNLLDADVPDEGQIGRQVDRVLAARGRLEREFTMMSLDLRKVLSIEQWRELKTIRQERGPGPNVFYKNLPPGDPSGDHFFYKQTTPGDAPLGPGATLLPLPRLPAPEDSF